MRTLCVLGRQPDISVAELESLYGDSAVTVLSDEVALVSARLKPADQRRLGGTLKMARFLTRTPAKDWQDVEQYLKMTLPTQLDTLPDRKIHFGLSVYGAHLSLKKLQKTSFALKRELKKLGASIRIIPNQHLALSTAQVFHNNIVKENGIEIIICKASDGYVYIGKTISVQDIDAYTARDQQRPKRDARVGMLPPKLAQIVINLAIDASLVASRQSTSKHEAPHNEQYSDGLDAARGSSDNDKQAEPSNEKNSQGLGAAQGSSENSKGAVHASTVTAGRSDNAAIHQEQEELMSSAHEQASATLTVLDPFCGTGVVLQEALLMGYQPYGTDIDPRMISYSQTNLKWLNIPVAPPPTLEVGDATEHTWEPMPDVIACETYLGRPFSAPPKRSDLNKVMRDVDTIHRKFLENVAAQTEPGFRLCLAVPAWHTARGFIHLPVLDSLEKLGYNRTSFVHADNEKLIYHRQGQIVGRELVVLTRT